MALSTCKVCLKAICLMCVHEEKDGTFCSEACISNLREVNDWVGTGSPPPPPSAEQSQPVAAAVEAAPASTVFEEMPEHVAEVSHPDPVAIPEEQPAAPSEPPPPSTSSIGNPCFAHPDIRAKAFCRRCRKPICGLCIVENAAGMFCSDACVSLGRSKTKMGMGTKAAVAAIVLLALGGAVYAAKPELFKGIVGGPAPAPPKVEPREKKDPKPQPPKPEIPKPELPKPELPKPPKPELPKPELPKPEVVRQPDPAPLPLPPKPLPPKAMIMVHPWTVDEPGAWYRVRRGDQVEDVGLKQRDPVSYTISRQEWTKGESRPVSETTVEIEPIELLGEEPVEIEGRPYPCQVRRQKDRKEWTLIAGRHAGAVLRVDSPAGTQEAVRLWEHTVRLGDRSFDCLVVESRESGGHQSKSWYCPTYPLRIVRLERDGNLVEALVEYGSAWASRKAPK